MIRFRVDDYPGTKPAEFHRHNLDNFKRFHELMARFVTIPYVLGVIPVHTSDDDLRWLGGQRQIEIALHGVNHDERFPNEFREYQTTKDRYLVLRNEKGIMEELTGQEVKVYIPPHNVVDQSTVSALRDAGFKELFTGPETDHSVLAFALECGLTVIRHVPPFLYGRSDELVQRGVVDFFRGAVDISSGIPCNLGLHWTWEHNIGLENLEKMLSLFAQENLL